MTRILAVALAAVALAATLFIVPGPVFGAQPMPVHFNFSESSPGDVVCGIPVDTTVKGQSTISAVYDEDGNFLLWRGTSSATQTVTAANGTSVIVHWAGQLVYSDPPVIDEDLNTITWVSTSNGMPVQVRAPGGQVMFRETGLISVAWTSEYDTTSPDDTGSFLSYEILASHGPHPEHDSDFKAFCAVIAEALA